MARRSASSPAGQSRLNGPPKVRKQEIIDAAARIFYEKSYHGASIQDVADEVGILKGSLYYYIDNKEDLLFETLNDQNDRYWAVLHKVQEETGSALDKLRLFIREHLRVVTKDVLTTTVFFRDFYRLSADRRKPILDSRRSYEKTIVDLIGQAQREGSIAPDLDPALTARALFGMLNWSYTWYKPRGSASPDDLANLYIRILLGGVGTEHPTPPKR